MIKYSDSSIKKREFLTVKEVERLDSSISILRDRIILNVLYETGCTVNELININITGEFGYGVITLYSALTYLNKTNLNQPNPNLENSKKVSEKLKKHIIDFIKNFDLDLFEKIPDKQIEEFIERKKRYK